MLRSINGRFRLIGGIVLLAMALAVIPAVGSVFAGAPATSPVKQTAPQSGMVQQHQARPEASGNHNFPAAKQVEGKTQGYVRPDTAVSFQLDDGTLESSIGFGAPGPPATESAALWLNRFTPYAPRYPITIQTIQ